MKNLKISIWCAAFVLTACGNDETVQHYKASKEIEATRALTSKFFNWDKPADWVYQTPQNTMQLSSYIAPGLQDKHAENPITSSIVTVSYIQGDTGELEENVKRWATQVEYPTDRQLESTIQPLLTNYGKVYLVRLFNTNNPQDNILGAIYPSSQGTLYIKMRGPLKTIKWQSENFLSFVESIEPKE